jgi:pyruvate kinase
MILPGTPLDLPTLTEKDEDDVVDFGLTNGVDIVAANLVRKASDIEYIREVLGPKGAHIKIMSAIENREGFENFHEILAESDAIIINRNALGLELAPEKVFLA